MQTNWNRESRQMTNKSHDRQGIVNKSGNDVSSGSMLGVGPRNMASISSGKVNTTSKMTPASGGETYNQASAAANNQLQPGLMKGPNAPLLPVDILVKEVQPKTWNNIPVPLCEAI